MYVELDPIVIIEMSDETLMRTVLQGTCDFDLLPPLNKKVVRIFVSSTFSGELCMAVFAQSIKYGMLRSWHLRVGDVDHSNY